MRKTFDNGSWFDTESAKTWQSEGWFNESETLWRTRKGTFVLETGDVGDGGKLSLMTADEGVVWLIRNNHDVPEDLSDKQADLEI